MTLLTQTGNGAQIIMKPNKTKWEERYWEMIYKQVNPFRKKGEKPIKDYVVCCGRDCHDEIKHFISTLLSEQKKEIGKEFKKWFNSDDEELVEDAIERILGVKV